MEIEIGGLVGFAFAATRIAATIYERQSDILHGSYRRGREHLRTAGLSWNPLLFRANPLGRKVIARVDLSRLRETLP